MNANKDFTFGQNYDSDYLCGKRFRRTACVANNGRKVTANGRQLVSRRRGKHLEAIDKSRRYSSKAVHKKERLTLKAKTTSRLDDNYRKREGMYANGFIDSNGVDTDTIREDRHRFAARIREDLSWILNKQKSQKRQSDDTSRPALRRDEASKRTARPEEASRRTARREVSSRPTVCRKPMFAQKEAQKYWTKTSDDMSSAAEDSDDSVQLLHKRNDGSRLRTTKDITVGKTDRNVGKSFTKMNNKKQLNCLETKDICKKDGIKANVSANKPLPSLPSSLTIVNNLMTSYENERSVFAQRCSRFSEDMIVKCCDRMNEISISYKQTVKDNPLLSHDLSTTSSPIERSDVYSTPKPKKPTTGQKKDNRDNNRQKSEQNSDLLDKLNTRLTTDCQEVSEVVPNVGNMMSKILLNISDAFQILSTKCKDQKFFD